MSECCGTEQALASLDLSSFGPFCFYFFPNTFRFEVGAIHGASSAVPEEPRRTAQGKTQDNADELGIGPHERGQELGDSTCFDLNRLPVRYLATNS